MGIQCGECVGRCDGDGDCEGDLKCFTNAEDKTIAVPGCSGIPAPFSERFPNSRWADTAIGYCYDPTKATRELVNRECSRATQCEPCQGSCTTGDDCATGSWCFQVDQTSVKAVVPGCVSGDRGDASGFCYNPESLPPKQLKVVSTCSKQNPCLACMGGCRKDSHCKGKFRCFQRVLETAVPGCDAGGAGDVSGANYCYDPDLDTSKPKQKGGKGGKGKGKGGKGRVTKTVSAVTPAPKVSIPRRRASTGGYR